MQATAWALETVARQRQEAVRQEVARCRARQRPPGPRAPWRVRLGWALVEVGLRLAVGRRAGPGPGLGAPAG